MLTFIIVILTIFFGFGFAFMCITKMISKSNEHGTDKALFMDFTKEPLNVFFSNDSMMF